MCLPLKIHYFFQNSINKLHNNIFELIENILITELLSGKVIMSQDPKNLPGYFGFM